MTNLKLKEGQRLPQHPQVESDRARVKSRASVVSLLLTAASFSPSSPQCSAWHTVDTPANTSCVTKARMEAAHSVYAPILHLPMDTPKTWAWTKQSALLISTETKGRDSATNSGSPPGCPAGRPCLVLHRDRLPGLPGSPVCWVPLKVSEGGRTTC